MRLRLQSPVVSGADDQPDERCAIDAPGAVDQDAPFGGMHVTETEALPEAEGRIRSGKLAGRSMWSAIWILALPVLFQQLAQACLGLFDKIFAGGLPDDVVVPALDGLGIGSYVGWFIAIAMTGLGIGGQALIARAIGGGRVGEGERALGQAMSLSAVWGGFVGVTLWLAGPLVATICGLEDQAFAYCVGYIRVLAYAMPFAGMMIVGSMCLHGAGETTKPAVITVLVNIINIIFSWILSGAVITIGELRLENPFPFNWHVDGIAAGTSIAYFTGALMTVSVLRRGVKDLRLEPREMTLDRSMVWRIVRIGVPSFLEGISMWAVNLFVLMFIGILDVPGYQGAHIITVQWESFSFLPGFAIGTAAGALAGQYLGAGNPRMARNAVLACTGIAIVVMGFMGVVFILFGEQLTAVISDEPVHMEHVPNLLFICGLAQVLFAITMVVRQGLRGVGDTTWTLIITTVSSYGCRLPAAWFFGLYLGMGLEGIWIGLCGEFLIRSALFCARFFHGGWKHKQI
jgi:putative MATE family efflux protein